MDVATASMVYINLRHSGAEADIVKLARKCLKLALMRELIRPVPDQRTGGMVN